MNEFSKLKEDLTIIVNDQYQGKCTDSFYPGLNKSIRYVYLI